ALVKASGLRGRGGAGFSTGMKWQYVDKKSPNPKYLACNADESEPGTFKDHVLMERNPHLLIEGCAIACHAIGAKVAYIYIRGEFFHVQTILERAIAEAYKKGFIGRNVLGSGFDCDVYMHRGAGAYEAGEETALLESLEGKRAVPRNKPPFPAVVGLYNAPTAVNNVETLCNVPLVVLNGAEWFATLGPEKNGGPKLYCVSGHVKKPGVYEAAMDTTLRELIYGEQFAGGMRGDRKFKAIIPGGSSVPLLLEKDLDLLFGVSNNIVGKTLCAFGDAAATPVLTTMKLFRHEYEAHVREGRCTLPADWRSSKAPTFAGAH